MCVCVRLCECVCVRLCECADLDDVRRFLCIFLEQQHGGGVGVDVELAQQAGRLGQTLVYVAKTHVVPEGKRCELGRGGLEETVRGEEKGGGEEILLWLTPQLLLPCISCLPPCTNPSACHDSGQSDS